MALFRIWEGGLSFHGGLLGVITSFLIFSESRKISFFDLSDHMAIYLPLGLGSVRVGNFLGGELLGRPTEMPWGIIYSNDPLSLVRHPSQLYQAFFEGLVMFLILFLVAKKNPPKKLLSGMFLLLYGTFRSITENFRTPDSHIGFDLFDTLTRGQLLSLPMIIFGIVLIYLSLKKNNESVS
jgi:phosphatidylglycerol:prolipoprotein diacylglycerol transferase